MNELLNASNTSKNFSSFLLKIQNSRNTEGAVKLSSKNHKPPYKDKTFLTAPYRKPKSL